MYVFRDGGAISAAGVTSVTTGASAAVSLGRSDNDFYRVAVSAPGSAVALSDANDLYLGATSAGPLTMTVGGNLTQSAGAIVTGATTVTAGSGAVMLTHPDNNFVSVAVSATGQAVSVTDANALDLGAITASSLTVNAGGSITQSGAIAVTGASAFTATDSGDITLNNAANNFNSLSLMADSANGGAISVIVGI